MSIVRLTHIGICVSDLDRSLRFYRDGLGFELLSDLEIAGEPASSLLSLPDLKLKAVYLERDGTRIELLHYAIPGHQGRGERRAMNALGFTHLSVRVQELEGTVEHLRSHGAQVFEETNIYNPDFNAGAIMIADPDGTLIELVEAPGDPTLPPGSA